jgi:hypothetical protein
MKDLRKGAIAIIPAHVRYSDLSSTAKLMYAELTCHLDLEGYTTLSDTEIGAVLNIDARQARRIIKDLVSYGFVTSIRGRHERKLQVFTAAQMAENGQIDQIKNGQKCPLSTFKNGQKSPLLTQNGQKSPLLNFDTLLLNSTTTTKDLEVSQKTETKSPTLVTHPPLPPAPAAPTLDSVTADFVTTDLPAPKIVKPIVTDAQVFETYALGLMEDTEGEFWNLMFRQVGEHAKSMLDTFLSEVKAMGKADQGYSDFKRHFRSWALKQPKGGWGNKPTAVPGAAPAPKQKPARRSAATSDDFMKYYPKP